MASCARPPATGTTLITTAGSNSSTTAPIATGNKTIDFPEAVAIRVVEGADGSTWAVWANGTELFVAEVDPGSGSAGPPIVVSGPEGVINHPLERPAMAISA